MHTSREARRRALLVAALASALAWRARAAEPAASAARDSDPRAPTMPVRSRHVGINLAGISYWTSEFPFADLVKNSGGFSAWRNGSSNGAGTLALRPDGWPARLDAGQSAVAAVAWNDTRYVPGAYIVRWDGDGELAFPLTEARVASRSPRRIVLEVSKTSGPMFVAIQRTNPEDPVRNLRFLWPGTESTHATQPFNPLFLARVAPFSTLRFMDWGRTNHSPIARWSDRPTPALITYSEGTGVPLETMLALANTLRAHPWVCVPHAADDDYVQRLARLVKEALDPALVATIEYSNEVWNGSFAQARHAVEQARRAGMPVPAGFGSIWVAERTRRIAAMFAEVFGAAEKRRWRTVLGAQAAWTRFAEDALAWKDTAKVVDALAIAPYFEPIAGDDPRRAEVLVAASPEELLERMRANIRGAVRQRIVEHARLAKRHGLRLDAYEAGAGGDTFWLPAAQQDAATARMAAAHASPAMRALYREYLETWIENGGELLNQYNDVGRGGKFGFWGALDTLTQDPATAPKYLALLDAIAAHPLAPR